MVTDMLCARLILWILMISRCLTNEVIGQLGEKWEINQHFKWYIKSKPTAIPFKSVKSRDWKANENEVDKNEFRWVGLNMPDTTTTITYTDHVTEDLILSGEDTPNNKSLPALSNRLHDLHLHMSDRPLTLKAPDVASLSASIQGTVLWAIGIFGTVANGAVFITVICSRRLKKALYLLIGTLAATDLFITMIYIPAYTYYLLQVAEVVSVFCTVSRILFVEIASVTLTIKTLIAIYFYVLARHREQAKVIFTPRNTVLLVLLAWFANGCVLFGPEIIGLDIVDFFPNESLCPRAGRNTSGRQPSIFAEEITRWICPLVTLIVYVAQLLIILICFGDVHSAIHKAKAFWVKSNAEDTSTRMHYSRAEKTMCIIFITFCLCWLPMNIINIIDIRNSFVPKWVYNIAMCLLLLKSAINPCIYIYGVRAIRFELKVMCICKCRSTNVKLPKVIVNSDDSYIFDETLTGPIVKTNSVNMI